MNGSLWSASRATHLKIVVVSVLAAIAVAAIGINARITNASGAARIQSDGAVVKAGKPMSYSANTLSEIR